MAKITYNTSPYTGDADLPHSPAVTHHCPDCKGLGRVSDILNGISIHKCPNCGGTGKIIQSDIILRDQPQATHHCINCEAAAREHAELQALCDRQAALLTGVAVALRGPEPPLTKSSHHDLPERAAVVARELADLKSDKAWADKLSAENADELSNLRREHEGMTGVPIICGCGDHIGYAEVIGLSQDGAVCGNCATSRKDYDARTELATLRAGILEVIEDYPQSIKPAAKEALQELLNKEQVI